MSHPINVAGRTTFINGDGTLHLKPLLNEFGNWWKDCSQLLPEDEPIDEGSAHLMFMAFLDCITDHGGIVDRDYAVGCDSVDIFIRWPYTDGLHARQLQREAIELEVRNPGRPDLMPAALARIDGLLDRLGLETGTLVILDAGEVGNQPDLSTVITPKRRDVTLLRG